MIPAHCPVTDGSLHKIISNWYRHYKKFGHIAENVTLTAFIVLFFLPLTMFSTTSPVQMQSPWEFDSHTVGSSEL